MALKMYKYKIEYHLTSKNKPRVDYIQASNADVAKRKFKKERGLGSDLKIDNVTKVK